MNGAEYIKYLFGNEKVTKVKIENGNIVITTNGGHRVTSPMQNQKKYIF